MSFLKTAIRYLVLLVLLSAVVFTAIATRDAWLPLLDPNAAGDEIDRLPPDDRMAREAVKRGIQAFYSFNSAAGRDAWLKRVCEALSQAGCQLVTMGSAPLWKSLGDQPFAYAARVEVVEKVSDRSSSPEKDEASQVWKTTITLNQPLPGSEKHTDTAYALVVTESGEWRFERFLTAPESAQFENGASK